ncbi:MAG: O-antigen translocase [Bacteroidota bacterium]|nr:O-antigen translocase [Bacteroidota bacterium]
MNAASGRSSLFKNFSALFSGLLIVQIINFLFSLILPKYFSPSDFAEFGIFTSVVFMLIEIVNAKLDIAVMLPKSLEESKKIAYASFTMAFILFALALLICIPVFIFYRKEYILLPFTILLYGIHQPVFVYLNKMGKYNSINLFRIIQVLTTAIVTLTLGIQHIPHSLIIGFIAGLFFATLYIIKFLPPRFNLSHLKEIIQQYDQFPKYGTWSSLLNNVSRNSVPILLMQFFSKQFVGFYSYSTRLLNAPTGMYASALGQVYFKRASEEENITLKKSTQKIMLLTFAVSIIPTFVILIFGKEIFFSLFSGEWIEAGKISQYLILWYFLGVIASPVSCLLDLRNKLKFEFKYNFVLLITRIAAIATGGIFHDFYLSILLFSITGIVMNLYLLYYINFIILKE